MYIYIYIYIFIHIYVSFYPHMYSYSPHRLNVCVVRFVTDPPHSEIADAIYIYIYT